MHFGGRNRTVPHLESKIPQKSFILEVNRHFQAKLVESTFASYRNYCIDSKQILRKDKKYHQILFVGGPTMRTTIRWRTPAIFYFKKKSQQWFDPINTKVCTVIHIDPLNHTHSKNSSFKKIQDSGWPPFWKTVKSP